MSNKLKNVGNQSIRAKAKSLAGKQQEQDEVNKAVDAILGQHNQRLVSVEELVAGLCDVIGMDDIQAAVHARRQAAGEARVAAEAEQLMVGVEAGFVIPVEAVDDKAFVVGLEHDANGSLCAYGPQQAHFEKLTPEFQQLLLGKKVGDQVKTSLGNTFQLTGVYHVDQEKGRMYFEEQQKKRAEEAAKAAAADASKAIEEAAAAVKAAAEGSDMSEPTV